MSHRCRVAVISVLTMAAIIGAQQRSPAPIESPKAQLASDVVLVEGWCDTICDAQCEGGCAQARTEGCTCYWVCENQESGQQICTGAIGVRICG